MGDLAVLWCFTSLRKHKKILFCVKKLKLHVFNNTWRRIANRHVDAQRSWKERIKTQHKAGWSFRRSARILNLLPITGRSIFAFPALRIRINAACVLDCMWSLGKIELWMSSFPPDRIIQGRIYFCKLQANVLNLTCLHLIPLPYPPSTCWPLICYLRAGPFCSQRNLFCYSDTKVYCTPVWMISCQCVTRKKAQ